MIKIIAYLLVFFQVVSSSEASNPEMNGISLNKYKDFTEKWDLVTVRYRKDTGEMRFTYANKIALKALEKGVSTYPEGSVFGKVSFVTGEDSDFLSSVAPVTPSRVQLMVRNSVKYKKFNGWGYGLFSPAGDLLPGDMKEKTMSCVACHSIVEEKGHVFSRQLGYLKNKKFNALKKTEHEKPKLYFKSSNVSELPSDLKKLLKGHGKIFNDLHGVLKKEIFYGTLDEIRPTLIEKTSITKRPSILIGEDRISYSVVMLNKEGGNCGQSELAMRSFHTGPKPKRRIIELSFCVKKK